MTGKPDFYLILGVKKTSSQEEIRRAYRKSAALYHPDRNPGDKKIESKFKEISEAYSVLSDGDKRKKYDLDCVKAKEPPPNYPVADVSVEIELEARERVRGTEKTVTVSRPRQCPDCKGSGAHWSRCHYCSGTGCQACSYSGTKSCARCWGAGNDRELTTIRVLVPEGTPGVGRHKFVAMGNLWGLRGPFYIYANVKRKSNKAGLTLRGS